MNIGELIASVGADISGLNKGLTEAEQRMQAAGRNMQRAGRQMTMYVTAPLVGIGVAAGKMSMDFEASMQQMVGLVGVSQQQVNAWKDDILELSGEVARSPQELADAMFFITSAGLEGAEALETLEASARAASAGLGDTKTVADLATSAMNAYGPEVLDSAAAVDVLTAAVREGKLEPAELAGSMGQVIPIASALHVSFDEVGAAMAAMSRTGTNAAEAATALRSIMTSLTRTTSEQERAFEEVGLSSAELRDMMQEEGGLLKVLQLLEEVSGGNVEQLAEMFPNVRALSGVMDMLGESTADTVDIFESMANSAGATDTAFETAADTMKFQWDRAMAESRAALISLGDILQRAFVPILNAVANTLSSVSEWLRGLNQGWQTFIVVAGGVLAAVGPVLMIMGKLLTLFPLMNTALIAIRLSMMKLNAVMLANPVLAVVAGVAALTAGITYLITQTDLFTTAQGRANRAVRDTQREIFTQTNEAERLFGELKALQQQTKLTAAEERRRAELLQQINQEYGEYLPNQIDEKTNLEELARAQKIVTENIKETIIEKRRLQATEEAQEKVIDRQERAYDKVFRSLEDLNMTNQQRAEIAGAAARGERELAEELLNRYTTEVEGTWKRGQQYAQLAGALGSIERHSKRVNKVQQDTNKELEIFERRLSAIQGTARQTMAEMTEGLVQIQGRWVEVNQTIDEEDEKTTNESVERHRQAATNKRKEQQRALDSVLDGLKTREERERESFEESKQILQQALEDKLLSYEEYYTALHRLRRTHAQAIGEEVAPDRIESIPGQPTAAEPELVQRTVQLRFDLPDEDEINAMMQRFEFSFSDLIEQVKEFDHAIAGAATTLATQMGSAIAGTQDGWRDMLGTALGAIQQIVTGLLGQAIMGMIAGESSKGLIGLATAAIGIGAIQGLYAKHARGNVQGLWRGTPNVQRAGVFEVGERGPELVHLPAGAAVTPNHALGRDDDSGGVGVLRLRYDHIEIATNRNKARNRRRARR